MFQTLCRNKFLSSAGKGAKPYQVARNMFDTSLLNKNKYFILNMEHKQDMKEHESYEDLYNEHLMHIKHHEDRKQVLLAGSKTFYDKNNEKTNYNRSFVLFEFENETIAYDFLKKVKFFYKFYKKLLFLLTFIGPFIHERFS